MRRAVMSLVVVCLVLPWASGREEKDKEKQAPLDPQAFIKKASEINVAEISFGTLASTQGSTAAIRDYGKQLVKDHTKANQEILQLAATNSPPWTISGSMNEKHAKLAEKLGKLSGSEFDKAFVKAMVMGHKDAIKLFEGETGSKNSDVKSFAEKVLPTLREHLKEAEKLQETKDKSDK